MTAAAATETSVPVPPRRNLYRLIFLPVIGALATAWALLIAGTVADRKSVLDRAQIQLAGTVATLADFNELAEKSPAATAESANSERTAAIWRALLEYPAASIWIVSHGAVSAGQPPPPGAGPQIVAEEARDDFTVDAALPEAEALTAWRNAARRRSAVALIISISFLAVTEVLARVLRSRSRAEREAAAERERSLQLAQYQATLEQTIAERTAELQAELAERKIAQERLHQHDALLNAVTRSAAELLGSHSQEDATAVVLELIGKTIGVSRVQLNEVTPDAQGHLRLSMRSEWCAPGMRPLVDDAAFRDVDLNEHLPKLVGPLLANKPVSLEAADFSSKYRAAIDDAGMRWMLHIPLTVEGRLWGSCRYIDSGTARRQWTWAETDVLKTLAELIGVAMTRARYVKELADANTIVQNSPTILYRVRGEPSFPLIYVSANVAKLGYDAHKMLGRSNWFQMIVDPADQAKVGAAMMQTLEPNAKGGAIEFRTRTGNGTVRWVESRYTPIRDGNGRLVELEGIVIDITERKAAEEKISQLARTDALTGLANRATFVERLRQAFAAARRGAAPFAILYIDLDHFKDINDTLGHPAGDALLREMAGRLRQAVRESDLVARLGGDEFAVLQTEMGEPSVAGVLAEKIRIAVDLPYPFEGNELHVTASIGICPYAPGSAGPDAMLSQADLALYRSKEEGRNQYHFHSDDLDRHVFERVVLAEDLRKALGREELELYFQPQVELTSGRIAGMEAVARWHHPERGLLMPADFLPIAEKTGSFMAFGHYVLDHACRQLRRWRDDGLALAMITVNLSQSQLKAGHELVRDVEETTAKWGLVPADLEFDVTEAMLAQATWTQNDVLSQLNGLGAKIAIDDFGTAYSSLDYVKTFHVHRLKIAQPFVQMANVDPERAATLRAIVGLAAELGIGVIGEGVETLEQRRMLSATGTATLAQGFYFCKPVPVDIAAQLLHSRIGLSGTEPAAAAGNGVRGVRP
jgi:diguanylate cyclase (GGDEF)-like protein/PAS domain S-box-containing protein